MGVCTKFSQAVPLGLELRPMILGGGIVVDESRWLGTLLIIPKTLTRLPFALECYPILHHLLVLRTGDHIQNFSGCHVWR